MYHALVKRIAVRNFERVNDHDYDAVLAACAFHVHHRFGGDHALGGERHDREALRLWFERLGRLCPDMRLTVHDVWVKGLPHRTTVLLRWTNHATRPDGSRYRNHGVHVISMHWGKVTAIDANKDSQAVAEYLRELADSGIAEAAAAPITS
ncbi:nuclear transport factor 2 family protein [Nakamurella aerolata]|uniref:SnoaL-like domain-containing protein n=1 Tax=Nakamurella aerolata TaxID=1656892 RepID=A0A849AAW2_9ACTN|nr:nuclear transport factor 2 family protein [Nakamurella aerolata]NNG37649.1 SnoaL-like domain-containing protein [Nakamurella aerolata]